MASVAPERRWLNPKHDDVLEIPAGESGLALFTVENRSDSTSKQYQLEVAGNVRGWARRKQAGGQTVSAGGEFNMGLELRPEPDAPEGIYVFTVKILENGEPLDEDQLLSLKLQVSKPLPKPVETVVEVPKPEPEPVAQAPAPPKPKKAAPKVIKDTSAPVSESVIIDTEEIGKQDVKENTAVLTPEQEIEVESPPEVVPPVEEEENELEAVEDVFEEQTTNTPTEPIRVETFDEPEKAKPEDYGPKISSPHEQYPDAIVDPTDGQVISLKPGAKQVVCFTYKNINKAEAYYRLEEDRSLPGDWIDVFLPRVRVDSGGQGFVAFVLKIPANPLDAVPDTYQFRVSHGLETKTLEAVTLFLVVEPITAVGLSATKETVLVGPFGREVPFEVAVANDGNSETAYRLLVTDPKVERDEQGHPERPEEIFETETWRYLFDEELEDLSSPVVAQKRMAKVHAFRAQRRGIWWFGWVEKQNIHVKAVPVTDPLNAGYTDNTADLVAKRWRLLPVPWFVMALCVGLFLLIFSAPSDLTITNAVQGLPNSEVAYIVEQVEVNPANESLASVDFTYRQSFGVPGRIEGPIVGSPNTVKVRIKKFATPSAISSKSILWLGSYEKQITVLAPRTPNGLKVMPSPREAIGDQRMTTVANKPIPTFDLEVPATSGRVTLQGIDPSNGIGLVVVSDPEAFTIINVPPNEPYYLAPRVKVDILVSRKPGSQAKSFFILTTDKRHPIIRVTVEGAAK